MASLPAVNGSSPPAAEASSSYPTTEPLEASTLDTDPDVSAVGQDTTQSDGAARSARNGSDTQNKDASEMRQEAMDLSMEEARLPLRKDVSMREFLGKMDDYAPVIPDAVTFHALTLAGLKPPPLSSLNPPQQNASSSNPSQQTAVGENGESDHVPLRLARLISLATQKFIADIATDAYQYSRMRTGVLTSNSLSVMSNPGAAANVGAAAAAGGAGSGTAGAAGGPSGKSGANAHVLGVQRAGFGGGGSGGGQNRAVLTIEDLGMAVAEYGVNVKRGEFYR